MRLVLASTSRYRRELLARLGLSFDCVPPDVDETAHAGEAPEALATRLARAKATAVAASVEGPALVIGSTSASRSTVASSASPAASRPRAPSSRRPAAAACDS